MTNLIRYHGRLYRRANNQRRHQYLIGFLDRWPQFDPAWSDLEVIEKDLERSESHPEAMQHLNEIWIGEKFWADQLNDSSRDWILIHEIGHWVSGVAGMSVWSKLAYEMDLDLWEDREPLPWGETNSEEAFASSFAAMIASNDSRWSAWQELTRLVANQYTPLNL